MLPFVQEHFPEIYTSFESAKASIVQLDIFRLLLIYKYGGIYIDLDIFIYKNFYEELHKPVAILESVESTKSTEFIQNAMFCAEPENPFIKKCIVQAIRRLQHTTMDKLYIDNGDGTTRINPDEVKYIGGPNLMGDVYKRYYDQGSVQVLSNVYYNPELFEFNDLQYAKHLMTGI
jgi:hypothetical protein